MFLYACTDEVPIYCIWLYRTDSKLAWLCLAASKNVNYKKKVGGMGFVRIRP
jgi:hypothetical protein